MIMKKFIFFLGIFLLNQTCLISQNATQCNIADPFCTGTTYGFSMNTNTTAETGPNYGCLLSQPNPVWYYLLIDQSGPITIYMESPTGNDIDFACWGPFTNPNTPCTAQLTAACSSCPNNTTDPSFYPSGNMVDCSYDPAEYEYVHISNAVHGQYYLLCITNYSNDPGDITFTQSNTGTSGHGTTDCSIVTPCDISSVTATPSACNPSNNTYSVSGTITFSDAPTTGQLVVTDGTTTQTFNAPFTSPINYTLSNFNSDGTQHTITVSFTADQFCTYTVNYTAPANCTQCSTNAGADFSICGLSTSLSATVQTGDHNTYWSCTTPGVTFTPSSSPTATVTVPASGTYTFTWNITNSFGTQCSDNVTVSFTQTPTSSFTATPVNCFGQASTITFTGSASTSSAYNWDFGTGATIVSGSGAGPYSVTWANAGTITITLQVTDNHCPSTTTTVTLNQPPILDATVSVTPVTCTNGTNGTVNINVSGGTPAYSYSWSNTTGPPFPAGSYSVTITDMLGCSIYYPFTVTQPNPIVVIPNQTNLTCYQNNSGTASVNVSGGVQPYTYQWTGNVSNTNSASNLSAGNYIASITDSNGCLVTNSFTITEPSAVYIQFVSSTNVTCNGLCNGSISIAGNGGTSTSYTYLWSNNDTTATINSLCAGTYDVTVKDVNQCSAVGTYSITEPAAMVANITSTNDVLCNGVCTGSATVGVNNGTPPYSYSWSNNTSNPTANNLCAGNYTVTVYDVNQCSAFTSTTINEPPALTTTVSNIIPVNCYGECNGGATVSVSGGTSPYTYNWSAGVVNQPMNNQLCAGTYFVTVTDANQCTSVNNAMIPQPSELVITSISKTDLTCYGSNDGTITVNITGGIGMWMFSIPNHSDTIGHFAHLSAGNYTVTVTDAHGCSKTGNVTVQQPDSVMIHAQNYYSICNGEWVYMTANASGGVGNYTYYWNGNAGTSAYGQQPFVNTSYTVSAIDSNGCHSDTATINVAVSKPLRINITATPDAVCPGDAVELTPIMYDGGGPPYTIYLQDGTISTSPVTVYPQQSGIYILYVKDQCNSMAVDSVYITVYSLPEVQFVSDTISGCVPLTVTFHPQVNQPGQSYLWNFGDESVNVISYEQNPVHTFDVQGDYDISLTITSAHGCVNSYTHVDMIHAFATPDARFIFNPESPSIVKPEVNFINLSSSNASMFIWSFGDGDSSNIINPYHQYHHTGAYYVQLIAITNKGCIDTAGSYLIVHDEYTFYAPTAISPDNDGKNDVFYVIGNGISSTNFDMKIFDRWGNIIYKTNKYDPNDPAKYGWNGYAEDGHQVPVGTYTWLVKYYDPNKVLHEKTGPVTVIR